MKKILSLIVIATALSASAYDFTADGIYYATISQQDLTCKVTYKDTNYNSYSGDIVIPSTVTNEGKTFSVIEIGDYAFNECAELKSVEIQASVVTIGSSAFSYSYCLESVILPSTVTLIGEYAFENCESLNSLKLPDAVTEIGKWAFYDCISLASLTIPESVTSIGKGAFSKCESLTSINIPNSVSQIGESVLIECTALESITGKYASADNRCLIINSVLDSFAPAGLTEYTIPETVKSIGEWVFFNCQELSSITIPNSVTSIGESAFFDCNSLSSLKVENDNPSSIKLKEQIFNAEIPLTCTLYVPQGSKELYAAAPCWEEFKNIEEFNWSGIENIELEHSDNLIYYDLQGRRVVNPIGGIYIHNGKKIFIQN